MLAEQLLVADYIAQNGPPRRFEADVRCTSDWARDYLAERGIHISLQANKWRIVRNGQRRLTTWQQVLKIVDEMRIAEGKQPFQVRS